MIITNKYNLPQPFIEFTEKYFNKHRPTKERLSVTDLVAPTRILFYKLFYWDQITVDASELMPEVLGIALHDLFKKFSPDNSLTEEKIEYKPKNFDFKIVGKIDLYKDEELIDYKTVSGFSFSKKVNEEYIKQLNIYSYILENEYGFKVKELKLIEIAKDFTKRKETYIQDFKPVNIISIPKWQKEEVETFLFEKLTSIEKMIKEEEPPECSEKEKWTIGYRIDIMQIGSTKPIASFKDKEEVKNIKLGKGQYLREIPQDEVRCHYYCIARNICRGKIWTQTTNTRKFTIGLQVRGM